MDYFLIIQPSFSQTRWCTTYKQAIKKEAYNLKLKIIQKTPTKSEAENCVLIILGTNKEWTNQIINTYDRNKIKIVTVGPRIEQESDFSTVMIDFLLILENAIAYSKKNNRNKILLYSPNPFSMGDNLISEHFSKLCPDGIIIYEKKSITENLKELEAIKDDYQTIICCNSIIATTLVDYLDPSEVSTKFWIIALLDSPLARYSKTPVTAFKQQEHEIGRLAVKLAYFLSKNECLSTVIWKTKPALEIRESTNNTPYLITRNSFLKQSIKNDQSLDNFDSNLIHKLLILENLFSELEDIDHSILKAVNKNIKYADIAEQVYASENTIKYRIKRMLKICKLDSRLELMELINTYAPNYWNK